MWVRVADIKSAGEVEPDSLTNWVVIWCGAHTSLRVGDVVVMVETPRRDNVFLRPVDSTLHSLQSPSESYVLVARRGDVCNHNPRG